MAPPDSRGLSQRGPLRRPVLRILLVEDNADHANLTLRALRQGGEFEVDIARYGGEALRLVRTNSYDVVILDYRLPDKSGLEILKEIMEDAPGPDVLLMTAQGSEEVAERALDLGAAGYIVKDGSLAKRILFEVERVGADRAANAEGGDDA